MSGTDYGGLGGVKITGFISPGNTNDEYAVIDTQLGIDGLRNYSGTTTEVLSGYTITELRRRAGMIVGVEGGDRYFKLKDKDPWDFDLTDWEEINFGGGSGSAITGGTYSAGTLTLVNGSGDTINISGFTIEDSYTDGVTLVGNVLQFDNNVFGSNFYNVDLSALSGGTADSYTDAATLVGTTLQFDNNLYGANFYNVDLSPLSGGTIPNYINSAATPTTVGGITAGSSFPAPGKTMQEMWDDLLYPYIPPTFNSFTRSDLLSSYEIGQETTPGVPVSKDFSWSTTQPANVDDLISNSVKVTDSSGNILLDSQPKAGTTGATIQVSDVKTSVGSEPLYTVHGINTQGASFTRNISATWKSYVYFGMGGLTLTGGQMVALSNSQFVTSLVFGSVLTVANSGSNYLWVCVPDILTNVGSWTSAGSPITDFAGVTPIPGSFQTDISITNSQGLPVNYKVWRQTFAQTSNPYKFQLNNV